MSRPVLHSTPGLPTRAYLPTRLSHKRHPPPEPPAGMLPPSGKFCAGPAAEVLRPGRCSTPGFPTRAPLPVRFLPAGVPAPVRGLHTGPAPGAPWPGRCSTPGLPTRAFSPMSLLPAWALPPERGSRTKTAPAFAQMPSRRLPAGARFPGSGPREFPPRGPFASAAPAHLPSRKVPGRGNPPLPAPPPDPARALLPPFSPFRDLPCGADHKQAGSAPLHWKAPPGCPHTGHMPDTLG